MAKKSEKKKNIGVRRRIRKTLGATCLITALLVAAIPVPEASAAVAGDSKLTWVKEIAGGSGTQGNSTIPLIDEKCDTIYTTEDKLFQFAWVPRPGASNSDNIAVILRFSGGTLDGGNLEIPDTVDAYTKYNDNDGNSSYVAVGKNHAPLFYISKYVYVKDQSGNDTETIDYDKCTYSPCYVDDRLGTRGQIDGWGYMDANKTVERPLDQFYYKSGDRYVATSTSDVQWIRNVTVAYIGNQYLVANTDASTGQEGAYQEYKVASGTYNDNPDNGVFANKGNIVNLTVGDDLIGIGNYAFYNCTGLKTIKVGNGIEEIGHHAFASCINMLSIDIDFYSNLTYISDYAFQYCRAMTSFILPANVTRIFDNAFEGCSALTNVDLDGIAAKGNTALSQLGYNVFKDCIALEELVLPVSMTGTAGTDGLHLNNFAGCSNLRHVKVKSGSLQLWADEGAGAKFTVNDFKEQVHPTFYFEADDLSGTHNYTKEHAIAFNYMGTDVFEIIIIEKGTTQDKVKLTYRVNRSNQLTFFDMEAPVEEVTIPTTIGPYGVSAINAGSFSGNSGSCFLKKITIPGTVTIIGDDAFLGCHNLKHVIFLEAGNIKSIGTRAFATQQVPGAHSTGCDGHLDQTPVLTFTGTVGNDIVPYNWAMNANNYINYGTQNRSYVTYYSGWPTNLEIQYVVDMETGEGAATLVNYPAYTELNKYNKDSYPYMTDEYLEAAQKAVEDYNAWKSDKSHVVPDNEWQIINAALKVEVPTGVKMIWPGLFSGKTTTVTVLQNGTRSYDIETAKDASGKDLQPDENIQSVTFADIAEFEPYSFTGCKELTTINITGGEAVIDDYAFAYEYDDEEKELGSQSALTTVNMSGGGSTIGDYAFCNNKELVNVKLSATVKELGLRPFKDCPKLSNVDFSGGPYFTTDNAIIYGLNNGVKNVLVECLESRGVTSGSTTISAEETAGITEIRPEAFMDCSGIGQVDLRNSKLGSIAERAFENTDELYAVYLPTTCRSISALAFHDSHVRYVDIPSSVVVISPTAFNHKDNPRSEENQPPKWYNIDFYCEPDSVASIYADEYENINITDKPDSRTCLVTYWYRDYSKEDAPLVWYAEEEVPIGQDANPPEAPDFTKYGYRFLRWSPDGQRVSREYMDITAEYERIDSEESKLTVRYWLSTEDPEPWKTERVAYGGDAPVLMPPAKEGYTFIGWTGRQGLENITSDLDVYAKYVAGDVPGVGGNGNGNGTGGNGSGNGNGNGNGGDVSGNGNSSQMYTLTVRNGSGSGSYVAGATVIIVANEPASTQQFDKWTQEGTADLKMASTTISATTLVMPAANTTVTANFTTKQGGSGSGTGSGGSGSGGTTNKPTVSGNGGTTTVIIDKNGLSNTGVVSVSINGSSDNFVLKISESNDATEAAIRALMAEYGSLDNIKYFPMDISLYDATGNTKITDTTGLSITITLPIPDSLITYAGNNKIAGVVNDRLDKLSPKFTTIDGVSCITFTAEHFSPYVMYVNTSNLLESNVIDSSPKTGDIHPKWFIALGLACMSVILFVKKDKSSRKVVVRA
ncbi:MAG: leucine-rich repeat protein [Lachnospiraceae bacterium]|nr:leucine-rich repeat protein [Lachnospiraceae bacterium]